MSINVSLSQEEVLKALPEDQKKEIGRMCDYIEESLVTYWEKYPGFIRLQERFNHLRELLKEDGDPKYMSECNSRLIVLCMRNSNCCGQFLVTAVVYGCYYTCVTTTVSIT